ncbi:D-alanine--D-alanine ligase [Glaciihabitans sp. dw_435]|uniref:D-alanine--D-alanine ligase family protein n=1 Tax=Glaciihabitans sp. dw_435 TaxID=2720081 RepID=UPI001BD50BFC|nr:D-alanine--D-alanine ligase [Glaciihabitans sp. dw_435]
MRIAVLFGGESEERDVSIASAAQVTPALRSLGHDVVLVDAARGVVLADREERILGASVSIAPPTELELVTIRGTSRIMDLSASLVDFDVVFMALHGGRGENGRVQSLLEIAGIPYTGSGPLGSALAMDKDISKRLFRVAGIPTPHWIMGSPDAETVETHLGIPVIVKPASQGSTVGLTLVRNSADLAAAYAVAGQYGEVIVERYIAGREITVGVLDGGALAVGEILLGGDEPFSYEDKYLPGTVHEVFPADLPSEVAEEARRIAVAAHRTLKLDSYSRSDFRLDDSGQLWLIEVNTLPGMTATSLLPQSAAAVGVDFPALCQRICELALRGHR